MRDSTLQTTRRRFLQSTAAAAGTTIVAPHVLGGPGYVAPSDKVNVALVGCGGQGLTNMRNIFRHPDAQVIAVADPIESYSLEDFYYKGKGGRKTGRAMIEKHYAAKTPNYKCAEYIDFRKMLEQEPDVDAVLCATPDHMHAYVSITAMRAGKHVYCEKPLTHNIWEARRVAAVAKETGVATQLGNQGHSNLGIRKTCEWIWDGAIGPVREVHAWVAANRWNKQLSGRPQDAPPVPTGVDWDLWIGPREMRPYHPAYTPVTWRDFWDFGSGGLGDFGCHDLDAACWALGLASPTSVESRPAGNMDADIAPHGELCYYHFGSRGDRPPVRLTWYDGGLQPPCPEELARDDSLPTRGVLFVGDKGKMLCDGAGGMPRLLPLERTREYQQPTATIPRSQGHHRDWLDACKGGAAASSNFEYGARLTEIVLLGVASLRTKKRLYWDAANLKAIGVPEADGVIKESYRDGWQIT